MSKKIAITAPQGFPTGWSETILICKKCSKKLSGGFGEHEDEPMRKALREALKTAGKRGQVGLIEVSCFGICPKKAVTLSLSSAPGELLVVPAGYDVGGIIERIRGREEAVFSEEKNQKTFRSP